MTQRFSRKQGQRVLEQGPCPAPKSFVLALGHPRSSRLLTTPCLTQTAHSPQGMRAAQTQRGSLLDQQVGEVKAAWMPVYQSAVTSLMLRDERRPSETRQQATVLELMARGAAADPASSPSHSACLSHPLPEAGAPLGRQQPGGGTVRTVSQVMSQDHHHSYASNAIPLSLRGSGWALGWGKGPGKKGWRAPTAHPPCRERGTKRPVGGRLRYPLGLRVSCYVYFLPSLLCFSVTPTRT